MSPIEIKKFHSSTIILHWLTLLLLIAVYACIELREVYPKGSDMREGLKNWHYLLGLTVWIVTLLRLTLRAFTAAPAIHPQPPIWQIKLSQSVHILLYALLFLMPLFGFLLVNFEGDSIHLFGLKLPAVFDPHENWAEWIEEVHETVGALGYGLIGLHALAGLFHHYIIKDNTMRRMLP